MTVQRVTFAPAVREKVLLRMALIGPTGAGKTLGALTVATRIGKRVAVLDTEHGRAKLFADRFAFDHHEHRGDHAPERYIEALRAAVVGGYDAFVIDSLSHEWVGDGGVLQLADRFGSWKDVRPRHNAMIEALASAPLHVIVTIRAKMKYLVEEEEDGGRKRQRISKLGVGPVQDENLPYEFDVIGYVDHAHAATFTNRCEALVSQSRPVDAETAEVIAAWLASGREPEPPEAASEQSVADMLDLIRRAWPAMTEEQVAERLETARAENRGALSPDYVRRTTERAIEELARASKGEGSP